MAILIKRYANRKLYNTETSRYITLKGIAKLLDERGRPLASGIYIYRLRSAHGSLVQRMLLLR